VKCMMETRSEGLISQGSNKVVLCSSTCDVSHQGFLDSFASARFCPGEEPIGDFETSDAPTIHYHSTSLRFTL